MERRNVGILGATGMVGQRFIQLLADHPWFNITWLAASDRSAGKTYAEACAWKLDSPLPPHIGRMVVQPNTPEASTTELPRILFAALDADIARELEPKFAAAGCAVISNSSAFRMTPDVPLVVPEVNASHLGVLETQATRRVSNGNTPSGGYIVTNPNCCAIGLVLPLAPLEAKFGIEKLFVSTMQAVSGAGYPGVASLDILGNVVPYIKNEEEKLQEEVAKLLGGASSTGFHPAPLQLSAHCNRVAVIDGHTECVSIKLRKPATHEEILAAWAEFQPLGNQQLTLCAAAPHRVRPRAHASAATPRPHARQRHGHHRRPACAPATSSTGSSPCSRTTPSAEPLAQLSSTPRSSPCWASSTSAPSPRCSSRTPPASW